MFLLIKAVSLPIELLLLADEVADDVPEVLCAVAIVPLATTTEHVTASFEK